ncbi:SDR family oxidoreductase [Sulfitobacter pseudonitzschiae]|uniref:SDR family oxidoreductase n=1 Tax=Pseudosulfitobacter pseudonitzschiae TaxID=1402135 RepID=A0A9Q2P5Z9_9RHOB|nr:SDR family oxidoreductase [Pseudosulfitobacter pseudonitzschiae]MBM2294384.1 SDR family oxidoreductase [Pseudosulfitobacter pseudonitzschiae]MBM2299309.1 SDR family oxidoreductase [Pseudosulfitobacter pseudonitzschiae]MBM2304216.1 SDR family oxidoreductase [Pseudosulfitobacter pseudonitzschiae]MBM2313996.1 SDR family oxidoreductase [Pseudosulfitobacter pseudonitzschiae]MBM2318911.1 SDR family oxidoreductase [Pseudosulfitobacter pseudonitzschiae]
MTRILITGGAGMVGRALVAALGPKDVIVTDLSRTGLPTDVTFRRMDVTGSDPDTVIGAERPDVVVHLASIVTPPPGMTRAQAFAVDVTGTRNVVAACVAHGVKRLVVTSSGAAYGYHADNPVPLTEDAPCRGNPEFAYADHKRQVEDILAEARRDHPALAQVVLRVGTVLGAGTDNQITALFRRKRLLAIRNSDSPFVFIWTEDLARIVERATTAGPAGIYNVAGDGWLSVDDLAQALSKPVLRLPAWVLKAALAVARPLGLSQYGPEQVRFLQYRPVLDNTRLKNVFGYTPQLTSAQVFDLWKNEAGL